MVHLQKHPGSVFMLGSREDGVKQSLALVLSAGWVKGLTMGFGLVGCMFGSFCLFRWGVFSFVWFLVGVYFSQVWLCCFSILSDCFWRLSQISLGQDHPAEQWGDVCQCPGCRWAAGGSSGSQQKQCQGDWGSWAVLGRHRGITSAATLSAVLASPGEVVVTQPREKRKLEENPPRNNQLDSEPPHRGCELHPFQTGGVFRFFSLPSCPWWWEAAVRNEPPKAREEQNTMCCDWWERLTGKINIQRL